MPKEILVVGAGYGGLSAAALLQKKGFNVTLLEAHSLIGGCASYFKRKNFLFDVGATTFSGVSPSQPVGYLFKELEIQPQLLHLDPGMIIFLNDKTIVRNSSPEKWIETCELIFGKQGQRGFWELVYKVSESNWDFISKNQYFLPNSLHDYIRILKFSNFRKISLLPYLFFTPKDILKKFKITSQEFYLFLEEQLLITTQSLPDKTPFLTAAMGLAYPSEIYYPFGGMSEPAKLILEKFLQLGGKFFKKEKVSKIRKKDNKYFIYTEKGLEFLADILVVNLSIWNLREITEGEISKYYLKLCNKFPRGPAAFIINLVVKSKKNLPTYYFQVHSSSPLPFSESKSFFVSFSHKDDLLRTKAGYNVVTISLHTNSETWFSLSKEEYLQKKEQLEKVILKEFIDKFNEFIEIEENLVYSGTPKTYLDYTLRFKGYVGGIPHSVYPSLLQFPNSKTPFKGFYQVGDTVFPGQGIPAVVYSAISVVDDISYKYLNF